MADVGHAYQLFISLRGDIIVDHIHIMGVGLCRSVYVPCNLNHQGLSPWNCTLMLETDGWLLELSSGSVGLWVNLHLIRISNGKVYLPVKHETFSLSQVIIYVFFIGETKGDVEGVLNSIKKTPPFLVLLGASLPVD